jgi:hypothetical protein
MTSDLARLSQLAEAAREESGAWDIAVTPSGLHISAVGDGGAPGHAAARFLREGLRDVIPDLIAELTAGRG